MAQFNVEMKANSVSFYIYTVILKEMLSLNDFSFKPQHCSYLPRGKFVYLLKSVV